MARLVSACRRCLGRDCVMAPAKPLATPSAERPWAFPHSGLPVLGLDKAVDLGASVLGSHPEGIGAGSVVFMKVMAQLP